jgi:hypothetical protein
MDILGSWGDGSQECCSMHLQLPYAGPHTKPRSHSLKDSMRKGENSWIILWGCVYFPSKSSTSILRCASAADRKRHRLGKLLCVAEDSFWKRSFVHRDLSNDDLFVPSFQLSFFKSYLLIVNHSCIKNPKGNNNYKLVFRSPSDDYNHLKESKACHRPRLSLDGAG